jgi:glycosyltransferase involved in cell wall biosynthesis
MKIVHALGWYFPESLGGTEVYVAALCRELRLRGHEVLVAAPDATRDVASIGWHDGVEVLRYPIPPSATRDEARGRVAVRGAEAFTGFIDRIRPDILHVHSVVTGLGLREMQTGMARGARVVLTHHLPSLGYVCGTGTLMQWGEQPCDGIAEPAKCGACMLYTRGIPRPVAAAVASLPLAVSRRLSRVAGAVGTVAGIRSLVDESMAQQRELVRLGVISVALNETARHMLQTNGYPAESLRVNRLGIAGTGPSKSSGPTAAPVRFGFIGRLHSTKGILQLAHAVRQLPQDLAFHLELAGPANGTGEQALLRQIHGLLDGDSRVTIRGPYPAHDVAAALASLDVLLCPSTWFENGPTVALEAQAAGTPVVGSRLGNLAEIIDDGVNGLLLPVGDVGALAAAMEQILGDPAGTIDRWREHLPPVRRMRQIADDYVALYRELLDGRRSAVPALAVGAGR